jgi:hypothetical protein
MHHLNHAKVFAVLNRSYFWPDMKKNARKTLENCPECELNKARQNTAHALFHSDRGVWRDGGPALIEPTSRYVVVIPLRDRFFGSGGVYLWSSKCPALSDDAPEFVSEALDLLAKAIDVNTTTTYLS